MAALYDAWAERAYVIKEPSVIPRRLELVSPDGGEVLEPGSQWEIVWGTTETLNPTNIRLEYNTGDGWQTIVASTPHDGSHIWTVPDLEADTVRVRVTTGNGNFSDESDAVFAIRTVRTEHGSRHLKPDVRIFRENGSIRFSFRGAYQPSVLIVENSAGSRITELSVAEGSAVWSGDQYMKKGIYLVRVAGNEFNWVKKIILYN
jgi:hypothetical protein